MRQVAALPADTLDTYAEVLGMYAWWVDEFEAKMDSSLC